MLESPVLPRAPPGHASSSLPPPIKEAHKLLSPSSARLLPSFRRCGNPSRGNCEPSVPATKSGPPHRPSIRINDPGSGRLPAVDSRPSPLRPTTIRDDVPRSGCVSAAESARLAPAPRPSICIDNRGHLSRRPAPPPRPIVDPSLVRFPLRAIDPRCPRPRPSTPVDDPWPSTPVDDSSSGRSRSIDSRPSGPGPRPSIRAIDSRPAPPPRPVDDAWSGPLPLPAIDSCSPTRRPRPLIHVHDPGSSRVRGIDSLRSTSQPRPSIPGHVHNPKSGRFGDINLRHPASQPRPSIRVDGPGSGRLRAANSRRPAARPRPLIQVDSPRVLGKPSLAPEVEEVESEIERLNELQLGEDISYEEYSVYIKQLPSKSDVDISIKLDDLQLKEINTRHELYRIKYQLSKQVHDSRLDDEWSFHPDYCRLAGLDDYQRLVPRNYGGYEYAGWDEYCKYFHSYEIEQEYIKYCEDLSQKLKWMEAYVPNKYPSLKWGRILTRGTYQAIKIATDFSKITGVLAFKGFNEGLDSMIFDVCFYKEFDGVYYEIWQRYTNETKFRDVLDEVYDLNRFPLRQDRMRSALENDTFCSDLEEEFHACTTCLKEFIEDKAQVTEEKARELISEALRKETQKPKFYVDYCRKKIDIARAIGLISS